MIKKLIEDLATDKISLASGLTQAKIIASKIKNDTLKSWIQSELNGYQDDQIPDYRVYSIQIKGDVVGSFGFHQQGVTLLLDKFGEQLGIDVYTERETMSIPMIEEAAMNADSQYIVKPFGQKFIQHLNKMMVDDPHKQLVFAGKYIAVSSFKNIIYQTKQKLIDLLLQFDEEFPDFDSKFQPTKENQEKANNIVTYHIYGGTNNTTLGVGDKVVQKDIKQTVTNDLKDLEKKLKQLLVPQDSIDDLKEIITKEKKETRGKKIMGWLGSLTGKMIEKGVELKLPELMETIQNYM